jgi:hypothetical protein
VLVQATVPVVAEALDGAVADSGTEMNAGPLLVLTFTVAERVTVAVVAGPSAIVQSTWTCCVVFDVLVTSTEGVAKPM